MRFLTMILVVLAYGCAGGNSPVSSVTENRQAGRSLAVTSHDSSTAETQDIHSQYDFRWNNWGDSKELISSNDPGVVFRVNEGVGLSLIESGWTTDAFALPDGDRYAVSVEYDVVSDALVAGHYWFDGTMTTTRADTLVVELKRRYGDPETTTERRITWMINTDEEDPSRGTEIYINLPGDNGGGCLHYYSLAHKARTAEARQYNRLPIRVVVPDGE